MMGRWGKSKNKLFPRKLLIKKYIPKDSGQKKTYTRRGKKDFYLTMDKTKLLKSPKMSAENLKK